MMCSVDPLDGESSFTRRKLFLLPEKFPRGKFRSPHVVSLRTESAPPRKLIQNSTKALDILSRPARSKTSGVFRWKKRNILAEIRRMAALGSIFILLLFTGNAIGAVRSFEAVTLPQEEARLRQEASLLMQGVGSSPARGGSAFGGEAGGASDSLLNFSAALQSSALFLEQYAGTSSGAGSEFTSGLQSASLFLAAADLSARTGNLLLAKKTALEQKLPDLLSGQENALDILNDLEKTAGEVSANLSQISILLSDAQRGPLPSEMGKTIESIREITIQAESILSAFQKSLPHLRTFLGADRPQTVLFLLQNKNEIRATGGFIGNTMQVIFDQGKVASWKMTDIFHYSGQFAQDLPVPREFAGLTGAFVPHDCNRNPEFAIAAEECRWFLEEAKADSPDTIIAVHQGILEDLLTVTGPVALPQDSSIVLDHHNVSMVLSYLVEAKLFGQGGENSPKKFLNELLPLLLEKTANISPSDLLALASKWKAEKVIQVYSRDSELQEFWSEMGISGKFLPEENGDFIGVTQANVGGNKSDAYIVQSIADKTVINSDGEKFHHLTLRRRHQWAEAQEKEFEALYQKFGSPHVEKDGLRNILGAGTNKAFTKMYFPKGTRLLNAEGVELAAVEKEEQEKYTAFSFFFPPTAPGEVNEVQLFVESPQHIDVQNGQILKFSAPLQSGAGEQYFSQDFALPDGVTLEGIRPEKMRFDKNFNAIFLIQSL